MPEDELLEDELLEEELLDELVLEDELELDELVPSGSVPLQAARPKKLMSKSKLWTKQNGCMVHSKINKKLLNLIPMLIKGPSPRIDLKAHSLPLPRGQESDRFVVSTVK